MQLIVKFHMFEVSGDYSFPFLYLFQMIQGLKKFKLDWLSIWRFFVPYRDPSLLPRQWRIACGTQKSYKSDANKKAKRRLYELRRKSSKPVLLNGHSSSEKEVHIYFLNLILLYIHAHDLWDEFLLRIYYFQHDYF